MWTWTEWSEEHETMERTRGKAGIKWALELRMVCSEMGIRGKRRKTVKISKYQPTCQRQRGVQEKDREENREDKRRG